MKTTFIFTNLLVVAIQSMVNGQIQNNNSNSLTPTVKRGCLSITNASTNPEPVGTNKTEEEIKQSRL
ncbi:MAG: hypothetical protein ACOVLD_03455 [Bacteroidia bacterium]